MREVRFQREELGGMETLAGRDRGGRSSEPLNQSQAIIDLAPVPFNFRLVSSLVSHSPSAIMFPTRVLRMQTTRPLYYAAPVS